MSIHRAMLQGIVALITLSFLFPQPATCGPFESSSSDYLLGKSGAGRRGDDDMMSMISMASSLSFHPAQIRCTYLGIWGSPIWRVRVALPPPNSGIDSIMGSTLNLRPMLSQTNDTMPPPTSPPPASNALAHARTAPASSSSSSDPTAYFQSLLRETCGSSSDGEPNASEFKIDSRADGSARVEFRLAYARVLEDLISPPKSCVEEALEKMVFGPDPGGMRVECRMPAAWGDQGPRATDDWGDYVF